MQFESAVGGIMRAQGAQPQRGAALAQVPGSPGGRTPV